MIHTNLYTKTCFVLVFILYPVTARKYDVQAEAMRLYRQDFKSVLAKFRKSPDYLKILGEKYHEMTVFFNEVAIYALQYVLDNKLKKRVSDVCGYEEGSTLAAVYYRARGSLRDDEHSEKPEDPKKPENTLPETFDNLPETSRSPIDLLEHYSHFNNIMTVQERNNIRDLAFEVTGKLIHMIINSMGPIDNSIKSTRLPFGGDQGEVITTTEKDHLHTITKPHSEDTTQTSTTATELDKSPADTYRYLYKARIE